MAGGGGSGSKAFELKDWKEGCFTLLAELKNWELSCVDTEKAGWSFNKKLRHRERAHAAKDSLWDAWFKWSPLLQPAVRRAEKLKGRKLNWLQSRESLQLVKAAGMGAFVEALASNIKHLTVSSLGLLCGF